MKIWIWSTTNEHWVTVKSEKIWAVSKKEKGKHVKKGDKIIFYVNKTMHFHGIYEVKNDWHEPINKWPDKEFISVAELDLVEIQLGFADVRKLASSLKFIEKTRNVGIYLRNTSQGPANNGKPISTEDYTLIFNELKQIQQEPNFEKIKEEYREFEELVELPTHDYTTIKIPPPDKKTIEEIFQDVEKGRCAVPDFQRYWTWKKKQIEELWESIFQRYYVGSLLIWKPAEQKLGKTEIVGGPKTINNPYLILDGQQRITAIYYTVKAPPIPIPNTDTPYEFFLNINALLDPSMDSSNIIDSYNMNNVQKKKLDETITQYKKKIFPLKQFQNKNYSGWLFGFYDYLQSEEDFTKEDAQKYHNKLNDIFTNIWSAYEIPIVELPDKLQLDNVATIFERINSKGTPLGVFDLLNARFITYEVILKNQWENTKDSHENIKKWYDSFKNEKIPLHIIQSMSLSKSGNIKRKYILNLDELYKISGVFQSKTFFEDWNKMSDYVEEAIKRITSTTKEGFGAINYDYIPYPIIVPTIAALLKKIEDRQNRTTCLKKIQSWYWNTIFSDRYSSSIETTIESDIKIMEKWFNDDVSEPFKIEERSDLNTRVKSSSLYKAIMCLIALNGAHDFIREDPPQYSPLEDHHIFPKSKAKKYNAGVHIDSILNRTLIFDSTNKFLANKDPSEYLTEIMKEQKIDRSELQKRLQTHLISPTAFDCMLNNDFTGFIQERKKTIHSEFQKMIHPETNDISLDVKKLLNGENQNTEFKETLRWDVRENKVNSALEETVMKELACFMNASGGQILIGVDDSGTILGLERDYITLSKKNAGGFQEHITNLINKYLGKNTNSYIEWEFCQVDDKEIVLGTIKPSSEPVYITIKNEKKFYVRHNNTCQPYDVEEATNYISKHWI